MAQASEGSAYLDEAGLARVAAHTKQSVAVNNPDVLNPNFSTNPTTHAVEITWYDPTNDDWAGTMIRRKLSSLPLDETDGELVGISTIRNAHVTEPLTDPNAGSDDGSLKKYYYRFFPYDTNGTYSTHGKAYPYDVGTIIVSWANGSDEQIAAMLKAHHNGSMNVRDYWSVGDERVDTSGSLLTIVDNTDMFTLVKNDKQSTRTHGAFVVLVENANIAGAYKTRDKSGSNSTSENNVNFTGVVTFKAGDNNDNVGPLDSINDIVDSIAIGTIFRTFNANLATQSASVSTIQMRNLTKYSSYVTHDYSYGGTIVSSVYSAAMKMRPVSLKNVGVSNGLDVLSNDQTFSYFESQANILSRTNEKTIATSSMKQPSSSSFSYSGSIRQESPKYGLWTYTSATNNAGNKVELAKISGTSVSFSSPSIDDVPLLFSVI